MGVAIIIPNIRFENEYGKVTLTGDTRLKSLQILAENSYTAPSVQLRVRFNPLDTTHRGIIWSVTEGGEYATIDQNGLLTVDSSASNAQVTVKAASADNLGIYATKTITVTYDAPVTILEKVSIVGAPTLNTGIHLTGDDSVEMKYKATGLAGHAGVLWGSLDEYSEAYTEDNRNIVVDFCADNDSSPITKGSILHYNASTVANRVVTDEFSINGGLRDGVSLTINNSLYGTGAATSDDIYILSPNSSYAFRGIDIYHFRVKRSGVVIHDFRASVKGGVYGFYDIIDKTFISNTGNTGTITV